MHSAARSPQSQRSGTAQAPIPMAIPMPPLGPAARTRSRCRSRRNSGRQAPPPPPPPHPGLPPPARASRGLRPARPAATRGLIGAGRCQSARPPPMARGGQRSRRAQKPISGRRVPGAGEGGRPGPRPGPAAHGGSGRGAGGAGRHGGPAGRPERGSDRCRPEPGARQRRRLVSRYYVIKARIKSIPFQFPAGSRPDDAALRGVGRRFRRGLTGSSSSPRRFPLHRRRFLLPSTLESGARAGQSRLAFPACPAVTFHATGRARGGGGARRPGACWEL